jgi:hypothetical protein
MIAAMFLSTALLQLPPGEAAVPSPPSLPIATIDEGTLSGVDEARRVVVRTAEDWRGFWREHAGDKEPPAVDFTRDTVLAVFAGSRATAGWAVRVTAVVPEEDGVRVTVMETRPGRGEMTAQILTAPFHIVSVPRFTGPAVFSGPR